MYTVDEYRARYARSSDLDLLSLLEMEPQQLHAEAHIALIEELERRSLRPAEPARGRKHATRFPAAPFENRFGAWIIDTVIGLGPVITAAAWGLIFKQGDLSHTTQVVNLAATALWSVYYQLTKDLRGQSFAKKKFNLIVVDVKTGARCSAGQAIGRAAFIAPLNFIPLLGWIIEPIAALSWGGRRLGDRVAGTQVISQEVYEALASRSRHVTDIA